MTGHAGDRRRLRYGDVLGAGEAARQSVRRRDPGAEAHRHSLAGADRLKLTEHVAIIDLMNLADALLLRRTTLRSRSALKSPLFGLTTMISRAGIGSAGDRWRGRCPISGGQWQGQAAPEPLEQCERRSHRDAVRVLRLACSGRATAPQAHPQAPRCTRQ